VDPSVEEDQKARLAALRARRDNEKASALLGQLESAAKGDDSLMPLFIECAENNLTLGEICGVLRQVWGQYRPPTFI
jgi:methylmalonyl-CoA mutase N-terminal domain/subunit